MTRRDQYHAITVRWKHWLDDRPVLVVTTEAVLWEWLNACSDRLLRGRAAQGYRLCHEVENVEAVPFDTQEMEAAFALYEDRGDKSWSLTDCLSFVVMEERRLTDALSADHHFEQAGFRALLLQEPPA